MNRFVSSLRNHHSLYVAISFLFQGKHYELDLKDWVFDNVRNSPGNKYI